MERHVPFGVAAEAVGRQMTGLSAPDTRHVLMTVVALQGMIAGRVTVHAARVLNQSADLVKDGPRTLGAVRDRSEFRWALEHLTCRRLIRTRASRQHDGHCAQGNRKYREEKSC
jgi:hypothetical protein